MFRIYADLFELIDFTDEDDCVTRCLSVDVWALHARLREHVTSTRLESVEAFPNQENAVATSEQHFVDAMLSDVMRDNEWMSTVTARYPAEMEEVKAIEMACAQRNIFDGSKSQQQSQHQYTVESPISSNRAESCLASCSNATDGKDDKLARFVNDLSDKRQSNVMKYGK